MRKEISTHLIELNHKFYRQFGEAFAQTRRRIQPGIEKIINQIPSNGNWLDLGCGSGTLAFYWAQSGFTGTYTGIDFSPELLLEANTVCRSWINKKKAENKIPTIRFFQADLTDNNWHDTFQEEHFDGILSFAVLHHIPDSSVRIEIMKQVRQLLPSSGQFIHSVWQFQNSERIYSRRLNWESIGMDAGNLEEGDTLLDWRFSLPGQAQKTGLRYVHLFNHEELEQLAQDSGFRVIDQFYSDGKEGNLGLYQIWEAL